MSMNAIHPLPARQLIRDIGKRFFLLEDDEEFLWGPFLCQGYAWAVGHIRITSTGEGDSVFKVVQGFEDKAAPASVPVFGHWINVSNFTVSPGSPGDTVQFKQVIVDQGIYFYFKNESGEDATIEFAAYLRND